MKLKLLISILIGLSVQASFAGSNPIRTGSYYPAAQDFPFLNYVYYQKQDGQSEIVVGTRDCNTAFHFIQGKWIGEKSSCFPNEDTDKSELVLIGPEEFTVKFTSSSEASYLFNQEL